MSALQTVNLDMRLKCIITIIVVVVIIISLLCH